MARSSSSTPRPRKSRSPRSAQGAARFSGQKLWKQLRWVPLYAGVFALVFFGLRSADRVLADVPTWCYIVGALLGIGFGLWLPLGLDRSSKRSALLWRLFAVFAFANFGALLVSGLGLLLFLLNAHLPHRHEPRQYPAEVLGRRHTPSRRRQAERHELLLRFLDTGQRYDHNSRQDYLRFSPSDTCLVHTHRGALGWEIVDSLQAP